MTYEVVYVECSELHKSLKSKNGKMIIDLVAKFRKSMNECFGIRPGQGYFYTLQKSVDAHLGITSSTRHIADVVEDICGTLRWSEEVILVLDSKGNFVAGCTTRLREDKHKANEIDNVCVLEKHRGKGVCGLMVGHAASLYSERKDKLKIICETKNSGACKCYSKLFLRAAKGTDPSHGDVTRFSGIRKNEFGLPRKL